MSSKLDAAASKEVSELLRREDQYIRLWRKTLEQLVAFKDRLEFRDAIYRIYSRADKQVGGAALKSRDKIVAKLVRERKDNPKMRAQDIHDIIGITVVVYFESQRNSVADGLEKPGALGSIRVFDREKKEERGYHAVHFKIASVDEPALSGLKGEVQVKTLLHDGWAAKTHDMIYKPPIKLSDEIERHAQILGDAVQLVEQQSDIIRRLIERELSRETKRRKAVQERLMLFMTDPSSPDFNQRAAKLAEQMHSDLDHLRKCHESDAILTNHFSEWKRFKEEAGPSRPVCRLITLLASIHEAQDLTKIAREAIEDWIKVSEPGEAKAGALNFKMMAKYLFGDFEGAVSDARKALAYCKKNALPVETVKSNLAYFLAEYYFHRQHRLDEMRRKEIVDELEKLADELKAADGEKDSATLSTLGWVAIAIGKDAPEVRKGIEMCQRALHLLDSKDPHYSARKAYYHLHEERAFQRILDWN
jgi:ppGpp synthetase/RelA/SpoT-type nucleotidyltranferase